MTNFLPKLELHLPEGLVGMPGARNFRLEPVGRQGIAGLLRCLDIGTSPRGEQLHAGLELVVLAPQVFWPCYEVALDAEQLRLLGAADPSAAGLVAIVTWRPPPGQPTANLFAPLVFNRRTGRAMQVVPTRPMAEVGWSTEELIPLPEPALAGA